MNNDGSISIKDIFFGVLISHVKEDIEEMTYECTMKTLGIKNSIYLLNIKHIFSVIWKSISGLSKDNIESNLFRCLDEAVSNNNNYFDEFYERVVLNTLDELEEEEEERRNGKNIEDEEDDKQGKDFSENSIAMYPICRAFYEP